MIQTKHTPNVLETEYQKAYKCVKIIDKFAESKGMMHCDVHRYAIDNGSP